MCAVPDRAGPTRAEAIVRAVQTGFDALPERSDLVVKLDADVTFEPEYFARLLSAFAADPTLGIASGTCYELSDGAWRQRHVTGDHVWGAARAYRRECLADILPLEPRLGWDGIDEVKAAARGWRTRTLLDLPFYHHRPEGAREGRRRRHAWARSGRAAHYLHYRVGYLVLRALHQARRDPAALALLWGFASAATRREPRCEDAFVRAYIRRQQGLRELPLRMREALGRRAASA
jgi:cellulose synthase/poly-beta-1,6-N-acetylglucosamine synthase-like glycosyltransferase